MATQRNTDEKSQDGEQRSYRQLLDEFADPRIFPARWDLSELPSRPETAYDGSAAAASEPVENGESQAVVQPAAIWLGRGFAELRTFPAYWDLSG